MRIKRPTKRRRELFLDKLRATGNVSAASIAGECGRSTWYDLRKRDEAFAEQWDTAELEYLNGLEQVAIKRGVVGETEATPYTSYENGERVTRFRDVVRKSDRCLLAVLRARHPAYKERREIEHTSPDGSMSPQRDRTADYANLTDDELAELVRLERKARGDATA